MSKLIYDFAVHLLAKSQDQGHPGVYLYYITHFVYTKYRQDRGFIKKRAKLYSAVLGYLLSMQEHLSYLLIKHSFGSCLLK
jgi:hypothetical protein